MSDKAMAFNEQVILGGRTIGSENFTTIAQALMIAAYMIRTQQEFTISTVDYEELLRFDGKDNVSGLKPYMDEIREALGSMKEIVDRTFQHGVELGKTLAQEAQA